MNISPFTRLTKQELVEVVRLVRGKVGDAKNRSRDYYLGMCEGLPRDETLKALETLGLTKKEPND
jgi:hypothetical protein